MRRTPIPTAILDLPDTSARSALRAGLMAMRVHPEALPADPRARGLVARELGGHPEVVAFVDISSSQSAPRLSLLQLDSLLPRGDLRRRVFLTRLAGGHVSQPDRNWAASLGFNHLFAEFDASDCEGELRTALDAVAAACSLPRIDASELQRYALALRTQKAPGSPRALIRAATGLSAEAFAGVLQESLDIRDRPYRLQHYPHCFVGAEAVAWIARRWSRSNAEAVALGQALGTLGLLAHVAQEHPLLEDRLFYRLAASPAADDVDLGTAWRGLHGEHGAAIADRSYRGTTYPRCWIGSDGVTALCEQHSLDRHDAWIVLHRLMQFGLIEHVTRARPFIDGHFFYRSTELPATRL